MFNTQSLATPPSPTVTCPFAVVNSNMLTSICHTPGVSSSVYRPFSSVNAVTLAPPCSAVTVAPGTIWSAARTCPLNCAAPSSHGHETASDQKEKE